MIKEFQAENRWLSNFWPVEIEFEGIKYPSEEHAYMSAKSRSPLWKQFCANPENTAGKVKRRSKKIKVRLDWDSIKNGVMFECLMQKFTQEPFAKQLLDTWPQNIQEGNNWGDKYWGICLKTCETTNTVCQ